MLNVIPQGLIRYGASPVFSEETVPQALQKEHRTKAGVWAKAVVSEGSIEYILEESPDDVLTVAAGNFALIEPEVPHRVRVIGKVTFQLEFYRVAE